ncbi:hypothetical protein OAR43_10090 [Gammaproteobacteria bacterium]|nr:hypothetical protein [Gammaproteobacteria bacterium]
MKPLKQFVLILFAIVFVGAIGVNSGCSSGSSSGTDNPNQDSDQDGINNGNDPDADGDGIPNNGDQDNPPPPLGDPSVPCTTTKIYWPNDEIVAGNNADLRWELLPKGCGLSSTQNKAVKATGSSGNVSVASVAKYPGQLITSIRVPCDPQFGSAKRPVRYDFTELGRMLGDSQGGYQATISHPGSSKGCSGGDGNSGGGDGSNPTQCSDFSGTSGGTYPNCTCSNSNYVFDGGACVPQNSGGGNKCPTENGAGGTYPSCSCASGYNYNASTNTCEKPKPFCTLGDLNPSVSGTFGGNGRVTWNPSPNNCTVDSGIMNWQLQFDLQAFTWDRQITNRASIASSYTKPNMAGHISAPWSAGQVDFLAAITCLATVKGSTFCPNEACFESCKNNPNSTSWNDRGPGGTCVDLPTTGTNVKLRWAMLNPGYNPTFENGNSKTFRMLTGSSCPADKWGWWPLSLVPN